MKPIPQIPGCLPRGYTLDSFLTVGQFALWRQIAESTVRNRIAAGMPGVIEESREDQRVHPRTYLERRLKGK